MKQLLFILSITFLSLSSCEDKEINSDLDNFTYWNAHHSQIWDSTSTANKLIGTWTWVFTYCCPEGTAQEGRRTEAENISVKFDKSAIEVIRKGEIIQTTSWSIHLKDGDLYGLKMDNPISQLHGRILFSNNRVLFNDSYIDGENNYFQKVLSTN